MSGPWEKFQNKEQGPWDKFSKPSATPESNEPDILEAALRGGVQGGSLNWGDEAGGLVDKLINGKDYAEGRDEIRAKNEAARKAHPWVYGGSQVLGGLATTVGTGGIGPAAAALTGATMGLGGSNAELAKDDKDIAGAAQDTGIGAALGLGGQQLASRTVVPAANTLKNYLSKLSAQEPQAVANYAGQMNPEAIASHLDSIKSGATPLSGTPIPAEPSSNVVGKAAGKAAGWLTNMAPLPNALKYPVSRGIESGVEKALSGASGLPSKIGNSIASGIGAVAPTATTVGAVTGATASSLLSTPQGTIKKLSMNPQTQKYGAALNTALTERGPSGYSSTYYLMSQTDPEFRKSVEDNGTE